MTLMVEDGVLRTLIANSVRETVNGTLPQTFLSTNDNKHGDREITTYGGLKIMPEPIGFAPHACNHVGPHAKLQRRHSKSTLFQEWRNRAGPTSLT